MWRIAGDPDDWEFEPWHTYSVTLAIENYQCRNGIEYPGTEWTYLTKMFFVCPYGTGCSFAIEDREIFIAPNPASTYIELVNFLPGFDVGYTITIFDVMGRIIRSENLLSSRIDISDIENGIYIVNVRKDNKVLVNSKLVITK